MVIFTARIQAVAGKETEAEAALKQMVVAVEGKEPGALAYACHKVADAPGQFLFYEIYRDQAACDAHMVTPHFESFKKLFGSLLDAEYGAKIEHLGLVAGTFRV